MIDNQIDEKWMNIVGFPDYRISSVGRVYNLRTSAIMNTSKNNYGHHKITLCAPNGRRYTRSVVNLVAKAFVEPSVPLGDKVVLLDGNLDNIVLDNIVWRPTWYAWKYCRQLKVDQPTHYQNLAVIDIMTLTEYSNVIDAGMSIGLLFDDIWRSTYTGVKLFPTGSVFEITGKSMG